MPELTSKIEQEQFELIQLLRDNRHLMTPEEIAEIDSLIIVPQREIERYKTDPVAFAQEVLKIQLTEYQERILRALITFKRVCVRGPHGIGKTTLSSIAILWFITVHEECKIPTTASVWRQLTDFLWPEIHKWALRPECEWWRVGITIRASKELLGTRLELDSNRFAFAIASNDDAKIEGAHSDALMYVFDESKTIPPAIWDAAEGALTGPNCYALAVSTPGESVGRFYEIQMKKAGYEDWHVIHVTHDDQVKAGRVEVEWAESRKRAWGEKSVLYQRKVMGNFWDDDAETVITLAMVEKAQNRWHDLKKQEQMLVADGVAPENAFQQVWGNITRIGCDPARFGQDKTGWAFKHGGNHIYKVERTVKEDTMETAGRLKSHLDNSFAILGMIDVNGVGAGVFDRLREQECNVVAIMSSQKTTEKDKTGLREFYQYRDWMWWNLRDLLEADDSTVALPPDEEIQQDLVAARYQTLSSGKIKISDKDEMRKIIGRSPDVGDAICMALGKEIPPYKPLFGFL